MTDDSGGLLATGVVREQGACEIGLVSKSRGLDAALICAGMLSGTFLPSLGPTAPPDLSGVFCFRALN